MKYAVIYDSATGNTKMLADEIKNTLGEEKCVFFGSPEENRQSTAEEAAVAYDDDCKKQATQLGLNWE